MGPVSNTLTLKKEISMISKLLMDASIVFDAAAKRVDELSNKDKKNTIIASQQYADTVCKQSLVEVSKAIADEKKATSADAVAKSVQKVGKFAGLCAKTVAKTAKQVNEQIGSNLSKGFKEAYNQ